MTHHKEKRRQQKLREIKQTEFLFKDDRSRGRQSGIEEDTTQGKKVKKKIRKEKKEEEKEVDEEKINK